MAKEKTAVFTFGRINPPTVGHEKLLNKTISHAAEIGADHHIFVSHTHDSEKNPLSPKDKVRYLKKAMPGANVKASTPEEPSFMHAARKLHKQGYHHLVMVAGSDRVGHYEKLLNHYNGKPGEYNFKSIKVVSAGQRDPDAEGVEGMSGTKMREAAKGGNKKLFKSGLHSGLSDTDKESLYHKVRSSMGIKENMHKLTPYLLMTEKQKAELKGNVEKEDDSYDKDVDDLKWEDIFHLYNDDEVDVEENLKDDLKEEVLYEGLTIMQRLKKGIDFMKSERRREVAKKIALSRSSGPDVLRKRAKLAARRVLEKRLLGGRDKSQLSADEKSKIEQRIRAMPQVMNNMSQKLINKIRDIEKTRLKNRRQAREDVDLEDWNTISEISSSTVMSYKQKAEKEAKQLKPLTKGEYGDMAKNLLKKREAGIKRAETRTEKKVVSFRTFIDK